ncbi:MAG: hypothetical protein KAS67_05480, partial [Thermoplasmata archaeon]|nr:hypothetical protein [Thermoplasmata archaeon]
MSEIDFSVIDEEINTSDKDYFDNDIDGARASNSFMKIQPALREMIRNGIEGRAKVVVSTDNVSELAMLMEDYEYQGLIGTESTMSNRFVPIVLEVPIKCLHSIANLESVIGVYKYQSPCKSTDGFTEKTFRDFEEPNGDLTKENMRDPDILQMPDPIDPLMKDAISTHHAQEAWSNGFTGEGINVAIPDTGIDFGHPDLQGRQARVSNSSSPYYGWPIVFDQVSMSDFLGSGSANDTWYVNTSYSTPPTITPADQVIDTETEWEGAIEYPLGVVPKASGSMEDYTISGFTPGKEYCFAIRAKDEADNIAGISDNANATAGLDVISPSIITDLMVGPGPDHGSIWMNWTAPGDDGLTGTVDNYVIKYSTLPIPNRACFDFIERDYIININGNLPGGVFESRVISDLPAGETFYFSMMPRDEAGNEGDISNCPPSVQVQNDITPPAAITDLTAETGLQHGEVFLNWTAPGDDGADGTAMGYTIKYSLFPITTQEEFDAAIPVSVPPIPQPSGNPESLVLKNTLTAGLTYYFAIEAVDETWNYGAMSTGPSLSAIAMEDTDPPGQISDLNAVPGPDHATVRLFWNATGDDTAVGQATKYVIKYHTADDHGSAATYSQLLVDTWTPKQSGEAEEFVLESVMFGPIAPNTLYYFWVQAVDDGANIGPASASASVTSTEDTIAPEAINDLTTVAADDHGKIILEWTAPHDDGASGGACTQYVIKHSETPIIDEATFAAATQLIKDIDPLPPGTLESHVFGPSFDPGTTLYFAIKAVDDAVSYGPLGGGLPVSGVLMNDVTPPSTITDLVAITADKNGEIILTWTAPGDDDAIGTASQYIVRYREAFSEYLHVPYEKNQTLDDIWYNVTGIQSMSG